jgi:hypothetical protein
MNILVVIPSDGYIRNYLTSSALSGLENKHNVSFLVSDSVKNLSSLDGKNFDLYDHDNKNHKKHFYIFDLLMWRYRKKSSTFKFRLSRTQGLNFRFSEDTPWAIKVLKTVWRLIRFFFLKIRNYTLGSSYLFYPYFSFLKSNLNENSKIRQIIEKNSPDIIIFPCSAYDPDGNDIISISKKLKIKTFFLVDNWDNLSSKSIFWIKPDYLGVWGKQSLEHAIEIQGFSEEQIILLGTPRFNDYFKYRDQKLSSPYDFKYVLFVGTALAFDEPEALKFYEKILEKNQDIFPGLKLVYRPHPWRQKSMFSSSRNIELNKFKHIILDKQIEHAYKSNNNDDSFQPQLEYYPALINNAEFVTGGLTSMLIESVIFRKMFLGLIHDDRKHFTSMHRVFKGYKHFQGIESMDAILLCDNLENLEVSFINAWKQKKSLNNTAVDNQRQYYYYDDNQDYSIRLLDACNKVLLNE